MCAYAHAFPVPKNVRIRMALHDTAHAHPIPKIWARIFGTVFAYPKPPILTFYLNYLKYQIDV